VCLLPLATTSSIREEATQPYVNNLGQQIVVVATNGRIVTKNYIKRVVDLLNLEEWYNEQEPE